MKADIKRLWVEDLIANPELQGRGQLKTEEGKFCCLGRLCALYQKETGNGEWNHGFKCSEEDHSFFLLPNAVQRWAGLESASPLVDDHPLASYNDELKKTFPEIAALIEEYL